MPRQETVTPVISEDDARWRLRRHIDDEYGRSVQTFAEHFRVSKSYVYSVLNGTRHIPDWMAEQIRVKHTCGFVETPTTTEQS
jgi:hypothetical protein